MTDFSYLVFPIDISFGSKGGPEYATSLVSVKSGAEKRNINWQSPLHRYDVAYGLKTHSHINELVSFFHLHYGRAVGFNYYDWLDCETDTSDASGNVLSLGILIDVDPENHKVFQTYKQYLIGETARNRKITKPKEGKVYDEEGHEIESGWTADGRTGLVTFQTGQTQAMTWKGNFYVPARFDSDTLSIEIPNETQSGELVVNAQIPIVEIRE